MLKDVELPGDLPALRIVEGPSEVRRNRIAQDLVSGKEGQA